MQKRKNPAPEAGGAAALPSPTPSDANAAPPATAPDTAPMSAAASPAGIPGAALPEQGCCAYILRCADASLYCGWTNNLKRRVAAHNAGAGAKYTRARRPVQAVYWQPCADKQSAMQLEWRLKQLTHAQKLALIAAAQP